MFLGTYEPKLDDKGRMFLPARFREDMEGGIVLTRGQEHCIYAFPASEFENMTAELRRAPLSSKQARDWIRVMLSLSVRHRRGGVAGQAGAHQRPRRPARLRRSGS